jgi:proteasome accessory factor B
VFWLSLAISVTLAALLVAFSVPLAKAIGEPGLAPVMAALSVVPNHPFAAAGRRAQQKLLAAMRRADVDKAHELAARIRTVLPDGPGPDGDVVRSIERAVVGRRVVELVYGDRRGTSTTRTVEAHGLHLTARAGYLIGWCRLRDAGRAFRLDRIEKAVVRDEVAPERDLDPMLDWVEGAQTLDPTGAPPRATPLGRRDGPPAWLGREPATPEAAAATEATARVVRRLTAHLPGIEEHDHHGRPAWRLQDRHHDTVFAAAQDDGRLWVEAAPAEVRVRTATSPDVYERHHGLSIRLDRVDEHEVRRLLLTAYRLAAAGADHGLTWSDVIDLATGLPDVVERADGRALVRGPVVVAELDPDAPSSLCLRVEPATATALALADPTTFRRSAGAGDGAGDVLVVALDTVGRHRLAPLLRQAAERTEVASW